MEGLPQQKRPNGMYGASTYQITKDGHKISETDGLVGAHVEARGLSYLYPQHIIRIVRVTDSTYRDVVGYYKQGRYVPYSQRAHDKREGRPTFQQWLEEAFK